MMEAETITPSRRWLGTRIASRLGGSRNLAGNVELWYDEARHNRYGE